MSFKRKNSGVAVWKANGQEEKEKISEKSVYNSFQPVFTFSSVFGFLPLFLLQSPAESGGNCGWRRLLRVGYIGFVIFTILLMAVINLAEYIAPPPTTNSVPCYEVSCFMRKYTGLCFNLCCVTYSLYFSSSRGLNKFRKIIEMWESIRRRFLIFVSPRKYCFKFVLVYYGVVIMEHLMQDIWLIHSYIKDYSNGKVKVNFFYSLFNDSYPLTRVILHSAPGSELWLYLGGKYKVIAWNYADFLVMAVGLNLNASLSSFVAHLGNIDSRCKWKEARKAHLQLCELVAAVDDLLSPVILLTIFVSTYFICNQIYFQLKFTHYLIFLQSTSNHRLTHFQDKIYQDTNNSAE